MRGRLQPGQRLILRTLAAELGVSATPVREALVRLVSEQALELDERGTVMVPKLDLGRYIEVRNLRAGLESEAAFRAAGQVSDADVKALTQLQERLTASSLEGDYTATREHNERFHLEVCRLSRSPALFSLIEALWMQSGPILSLLWDADGPANAEAHLIVLDGLRRRDGERARQGMIRDIIYGGAPLLTRFPGAGTVDSGTLPPPVDLWCGLRALMPPPPGLEPEESPPGPARGGRAALRKSRAAGGIVAKRK